MKPEGPVLTFDEWSQLSAQSGALSQSEFVELLDEREISEADYMASQEAHICALTQAVRRGEFSLAQSHGRRCLRSQEAAACIQDQGLDETAPVHSKAARVAVLPFAGTTGKDALAELFEDEATAARASDSPRGQSANPDETMMLGGTVAIVQPTTGSFRDQLGAIVVPDVSLEQYVELCAELSVRGEDDAGVLARFGVGSSAAHSALKARFAERFGRDFGLQRWFSDAVNRLATKLREGGARVRP